MDWHQLLSLNRHKTPNRDRLSEDETRVAFEIDFDRIIFSPEFRSLQDKTQVIPLSKKDFVHTRLTHSMEVSVVGRSLGRNVGKEILDRTPNLKSRGYKINDFGNIVSAAALAHDIGNPPFGHGGEKAIGGYFNENKSLFKKLLTEKQFEDLSRFEGNANGFKILTRKSPSGMQGYRLTYATLGSFVKYPRESVLSRPSRGISDKKYGIFQSEKEVFRDIANNLGLGTSEKTNDSFEFYRHPLVFLVEAADDICYSIIDFEDGVNLGLISESTAEETLMPMVEKHINLANYKLLEHKEDRIGYLRALAINSLIRDVGAIFLDSEASILNQSFHSSLLYHSKYSGELKTIIDISKEKIYQSDEVIEKEIAGYNVLKKLLDVFVTAYMADVKENLTSYDKLILMLLPKKHFIKDDVYKGLIEICSFIAGLSDRKVVALHQKVTGMTF